MYIYIHLYIDIYTYIYNIYTCIYIYTGAQNYYRYTAFLAYCIIRKLFNKHLLLRFGSFPTLRKETISIIFTRRKDLHLRLLK